MTQGAKGREDGGKERMKANQNLMTVSTPSVGPVIDRLRALGLDIGGVLTGKEIE